MREKFVITAEVVDITLLAIPTQYVMISENVTLRQAYEHFTAAYTAKFGNGLITNIIREVSCLDMCNVSLR